MEILLSCGSLAEPCSHRPAQRGRVWAARPPARSVLIIGDQSWLRRVEVESRPLSHSSYYVALFPVLPIHRPLISSDVSHDTMLIELTAKQQLSYKVRCTPIPRWPRWIQAKLGVIQSRQIFNGFIFAESIKHWSEWQTGSSDWISSQAVVGPTFISQTFFVKLSFVGKTLWLLNGGKRDEIGKISQNFIFQCTISRLRPQHFSFNYQLAGWWEVVWLSLISWQFCAMFVSSSVADVCLTTSCNEW